jgi:ankyrin repeat protein
MNAIAPRGLAPLAILLLFPFLALVTTDQELDDRLITACRSGATVEGIASLLDRGANINATNEYGQTAVFAAADDGNAKVIRLLISKGADVNVKDKSGTSPLREAAASRSTESVRILLDAGAKPEPGALSIACWLDRRETVSWLIDAGISPDAGMASAAAVGPIDLVRLLIEKGAKINATSESGHTPLHAAAGRSDNLENVKLLLDMGADPNAVDDDGETPLHGAVSVYGNLEIVKLLVDSGAKINLANKEGITPIRFAGKYQLREVYDWLLAKCGGAEPAPVPALPRAPAEAAKTVAQLLADLESNDQDMQEAAAQALVLRGKDSMPEIVRRIKAGAPIEHYYGIFSAMGPNAEAALPLLKAQLTNKQHIFSVALTIEAVQPGALDRLDEVTLQAMIAVLYEGIVDPKSDLSTDFMRVRYLDLLISLGEPAAPTIVALLRSPSPEFRCVVIRKLAGTNIANEQVHNELARILRNDEIAEVQIEAATKLSQGNSAADAQLVLLDIVKRTGSADAARALGPIAGASIVDELLSLLSPMENPKRLAAITAFESAGAPAVPRLVELLAHEDTAIAISASVALNRIGQPAVPALTEALETDNEQVIERATSALWWAIADRRSAMPALLELAAATNRPPLSRMFAAHAAVEIDPKCGSSEEIQSVLPDLINVCETGRYEHRCTAAATLRKMGASAQAALPALEAMAKKPLPTLSNAARALPVEPIPEAVKNEKIAYSQAETLRLRAKEAIDAIRKDAEGD